MRGQIFQSIPYVWLSYKDVGRMAPKIGLQILKKITKIWLRMGHNILTISLTKDLFYNILNETSQPSLLITDNDLHLDSDEFMAPAGPLFLKVAQKNTGLKLYLTS